MKIQFNLTVNNFYVCCTLVSISGNIIDAAKTGQSNLHVSF